MPAPPARSTVLVALGLALAFTFPACASDDTTETGTIPESGDRPTSTTAGSSTPEESSTTTSGATTSSGAPTSTTTGSGTSSTATTTAGARITVVAPADGATVTSPFEVRGTAAVYESTVNYEVVTGSGEVLDRGYATAAAAAPGASGPFSFPVEVPPAEAGPVTIVLYEASGEDGSRGSEVEVRVTVTS